MVLEHSAMQAEALAGQHSKIAPVLPAAKVFEH